MLKIGDCDSFYIELLFAVFIDEMVAFESHLHEEELPYYVGSSS